jgi:hypothetical protein
MGDLVFCREIIKGHCPSDHRIIFWDQSKGGFRTNFHGALSFGFQFIHSQTKLDNLYYWLMVLQISVSVSSFNYRKFPFKPTRN